MKAKILVATHKKYWMPEDSCYLPLFVGSEGKESIGYALDCTGDNISYKNKNYCELTGLYWGWKNLDTDYIGLAHYRRHFSAKPWILRKIKGNKKSVMTSKEMSALLKKTDVILPKKRHYFIESIKSHYAHTHYPEPLIETRKIIRKYYPDMLGTFDKVMSSRSAHMFNMYVMKKELSDTYCTFLFDVLSKLEDRVDISDYDSFQARVYGRISEMLLDVWINYNDISYEEVNVIHMEGENWPKKGMKFIKSKIMHKYY